MNKYKKPLLITLLVIDLALTVFLFTISVIILAKVIPAANLSEAISETKSDFIKYLLTHNAFYFGLFVVPLFALLAANIISLVFYVKKTSAKENAPTKLDDLSAEQKEALRQELLNDLLKDSENKTENNKEE